MNARPCLRRWSAVLALAATTAHVRAEPAHQLLEVELDGRMGQSTAPYFTSAFPSTSGYGGFLIARANARIAERWQLGLRAPLVLMRVEQPAGALYAEAAWGNPELSAGIELPWHERAGFQLAFGAGLAVGVPLAEHDAGQVAGRALLLADALEGLSEPGLFTPGMIPIIPSASLRAESRRWLFSASLRAPSLLRVSTADVPAASDPRAFAFVPVATLTAKVRVWRWLSMAVAPRLTVRALAPVDDGQQTVQLLAVGRAEFRLSEHISLAALGQAPVGGPLGGSTGAGGLALRGQF